MENKSWSYYRFLLAGYLSFRYMENDFNMKELIDLCYEQDS